jgi:hypothetical protein
MDRGSSHKLAQTPFEIRFNLTGRGGIQYLGAGGFLFDFFGARLTNNCFPFLNRSNHQTKPSPSSSGECWISSDYEYWEQRTSYVCLPLPPFGSISHLDFANMHPSLNRSSRAAWRLALCGLQLYQLAQKACMPIVLPL